MNQIAWNSKITEWVYIKLNCYLIILADPGKQLQHIDILKFKSLFLRNPLINPFSPPRMALPTKTISNKTHKALLHLVFASFALKCTNAVQLKQLKQLRVCIDARHQLVCIELSKWVPSCNTMLDHWPHSCREKVEQNYY